MPGYTFAPVTAPLLLNTKFVNFPKRLELPFMT